MWSDCANLQSDLVLVAPMSSMSWKGTEKWSINQPQSSLAYFQNIPEVQALVTLSPHLNQKIISSEAHDLNVTPSFQREHHRLETMILTSTGCCWIHRLMLELGG